MKIILQKQRDFKKKPKNQSKIKIKMKFNKNKIKTTQKLGSIKISIGNKKVIQLLK